MCFAPTPPQENSSEDVFNLLILDENRVEVENHLRFVNGIINIQLEPIEPTSQEGDENEHSVEFEITPYGISNVPTTY